MLENFRVISVFGILRVYFGFRWVLGFKRFRVLRFHGLRV